MSADPIGSLVLRTQVWAFWLKAVAPHHLLNECTPKMPADFFKLVFGPSLFVSPVTFSPLDLGLPTSRVRQYLHCYFPKKHGVTMNLEDCFKDLVIRKCMLSSRIYMQAGPNDLKKFMDELADKRGLPPRRSGKTHICVDVMNSGDRIRMEGYKELAIEEDLDGGGKAD
eukprot:66096-Pyramimonas_sp.AAC.1